MINMKVLEQYKNYCEQQNIRFENKTSVKSYQEDTLFCIAGMQQYKDIFLEKTAPEYSIICNNQAVLRCNDIDEINDNSHYLYFNMLGYFDFQVKDYYKCLTFWLQFIIKELNLKIDYIEVHPFVNERYIKTGILAGFDVKINDSLIWQDGNVKGYSTEFYIDGIEVGNIVLLENGMLDVGFGLERLEMFYNKDYKKPTEEEILIQTAEKIIECGYFPKSNGRQEFILWDILKRLVKKGYVLDESYLNNNSKLIEAFCFVYEKYHSNQKQYEHLKDKFPNKDKQWWKETHGIYLD